MLVDAHAHLDHPDFEKDLPEVIERAKKAGVSIIINNGTDVKDNRRCLEIAKEFPIVKVSLGLYPIEALKLSDEEIDAELKFIESHKKTIIAIGEVGLDYYWEKDPLQHKRQKEIFKKIINLAEKLQKPLIVHSRNAEADAVEMLKDCKTKVVMHMFSADMEIVDKAISYGFYFTIPTNIGRNKHFQKLAEKVSMNRLFLETDCPYMAPNPQIEKRNEPANIAITAKKIAEIKKFNEEEVIKNLWMNYQQVFQ